MTHASDSSIQHIPKGGGYAHPDTASRADVHRPDAESAAPGSSAAELAGQIAQSRPGLETPAEPLTDCACDHEPHLSVEVQLSDYDDEQKEPSGVKITVHASGGRGLAAAVLAADAYREVSARLSQDAETQGDGNT